MKEIKLVITGKVQGVFYRDTIKKRALELGLVGFAKNEADGSVTVVAQGERPALEELIKTAQIGSRSSQVAEIHPEWREPTERLERFKSL